MRMNEWTNQQMNEIEYVFFNWFTFIEHLFDCSCICLWPILILIRSKFNLLEYNWANRVFSLALLYLSLFSSFPCESVIFCGKPLLTFNWEPKHLHFFSFFAVCPPLSEGVSCKKELFQVYFHGYLWISLHLSWFLCECCEKSVLNVSRA